MHPLISRLWLPGSYSYGPARLFLEPWVWKKKASHVGLLTLERSDEHVPILDEIFDEFICPLELDFMAFDSLSEVRAVQERVTELQSGESHCTSTIESPFKLYYSAYKRLFSLFITPFR